MAADRTSVSQRGDCSLAFPQLGRYQAEVMLSAARQKGLPEGEKPSVPDDKAYCKVAHQVSGNVKTAGLEYFSCNECGFYKLKRDVKIVLEPLYNSKYKCKKNGCWRRARTTSRRDNRWGAQSPCVCRVHNLVIAPSRFRSLADTKQR